ncbi:MAG: YifB family Mg chelatase-like AAA ATPase [Oribacterium sp.]
MLAKVLTAGLSGIDGHMVSVEVDESNGLPHTVIIGNVSLSVREALERCTVALKNSGIPLPPKRLTVSLQPADFPKNGTGYDLPILVGLLAALGLLRSDCLRKYAFFGEVGLDGSLLRVRGALSLCAAFQSAGLRGAVVPFENAAEAGMLDGMDIIGLRNIRELLSLLRSADSLRSFPRTLPETHPSAEPELPDFRDVRGQHFAVRAALIAAAGGHNLLLSGCAGSGKSMIAKRIPGILPSISRAEDIEITKVYSVAGLLPSSQALFGRRPFRAPHSSVTIPTLIGGSSNGMIFPGELALAGKGVLFLDELPLFSRAAIEALRQPLEDRFVRVNRVRGEFTYPVDCMLVAAMNPCPCGFFGAPGNRCHCTPSQIRHYQRGISKPILERIDLCVEVSPVKYSEALSEKAGISSASLRREVERVRTLQLARFQPESGKDAMIKDCRPVRCNAEMGLPEIKKFCVLGQEEQSFMKRVFELKRLSMRTYHKLLKLSRTIADLDSSERITIAHLSEAVSYRSLEDRLYGG